MKIDFLFTATLLCVAGQLQAQALPGQYSLSGKDSSGEAYSGRLNIVADGPVFRLTFTDGKVERGMGIQRGNQLFTSWGPNNRCSISALLVQDNGDMRGPWGDLDHSALGTETMSKQAGASGTLEGTYESIGKDMDGRAYEGVTTVSSFGQTLKFVFKDGTSTLNGYGVRVGSSVAVSYGDRACRVSLYTINADGSLSGPYAKFGESALSIERLSKTR
jgi:hypothetical protein